jgi:hypothetical protein
MEINRNTKIGEGDPSLALRDATMSLWYMGKEVAIRKLLFSILNFHRIATSSPFNHIKYCHSESASWLTRNLTIIHSEIIIYNRYSILLNYHLK